MSALVALSGSLASQSFVATGNIEQAEILGVVLTNFRFELVTTPDSIWITAYLSISVLLGWYGKLLADDRQRTG
jgi:hypothetical protein